MTNDQPDKKPWDRDNPRLKAGKKSRKLTAAQKASAQLMARKAGRPYPNLVDNMRVLAAAKKAAAKKRATKKTAKKTTAKRAKR